MRKIVRPYTAKPSVNDIPINGKLAMTPSKMMKLAEQGIPISSQQLGGQFYDGDVKVTWDVPIDRQRGVDMNDMWNYEQTVRKKMNKMSGDTVRAHRKEYKDSVK